MQDDVVQWVLAGAGIIAIALGITWCAGSRRRQISKLTRTLDAPSPVIRAGAAAALTELGLDRSARPLLPYARRETDPSARLALAEAIARHQWEPVGPPGVTELRDWASDELAAQGRRVSAFGPATTRLADMGGPRVPRPDAASIPAGSAAGPDTIGATTGGRAP